MTLPHLSIRTTLLLIIAILNLLIAALVGNGIYRAWVDYIDAQSIRYGSTIINDLYEANKNLSLGRGSALSILQVDPETAVILQQETLHFRNDADAALSEALTHLKAMDPAHIPSMQKIEEDYQTLNDMRQKLDVIMRQDPKDRDLTVADDLYTANTDLIQEIRSFILAYTKVSRGMDAAMARQSMFKFFVWDVAEYAGREYATIGRLIAADKRPTSAQQEELANLRARTEYGWDILRKFAIHDDLAQQLLPYVDEAQTHYFMTFDQVKDLFDNLSNDSTTAAGYPISIELWLGMAQQAVDSLLALQTEVLNATQHHAALMEEDAKRQIVISLVIFLSALGLSLYCWSIIVFRVARPINAMVNALYKATQEGTYEMPKILHYQDEIGKLVRVLEAFQDNARKIKRSNEELERFAYIAAHDLKSPLRAVDNLSQWLEEDLGQFLNDDNKKHMDELRRRVHLMDKLLDDTLEYASVDAKQGQAAEVVNGKTMVEEIVAILAVPPGFTIKIGQNLAGIQVAKIPLQQVLHNLVNNALKHHDRPNGMIEVNAVDAGNEYVFTVKDDGPGIAPQYHQKIFEMFQTLKPRSKDSGRGMGLAMVRKIVNMRGGTITVASEAGKGAEFRFTWPKSNQKEDKNHGNGDTRNQYA